MRADQHVQAPSTQDGASLHQVVFPHWPTRSDDRDPVAGSKPPRPHEFSDAVMISAQCRRT
jgi:hypothetical protein